MPKQGAGADPARPGAGCRITIWPSLPDFSKCRLSSLSTVAVPNGGHVDQAPKGSETSCGTSNQLIAAAIALYIGFVIFGRHGH